MKFGVLKDIKNGEYRVVATPAEVSILTEDGHDVYEQGKLAMLPVLMTKNTNKQVQQ